LSFGTKEAVVTIRECQSVVRDCALGIVVVAAMILGICGAFETTAQAETWMVRHSVVTRIL